MGIYYVNDTSKIHYRELFSSFFSYTTREAGFLKKEYLYLDHNEDKITKIIVSAVYMKQFVLGILLY